MYRSGLRWSRHTSVCIVGAECNLKVNVHNYGESNNRSPHYKHKEMPGMKKLVVNLIIIFIIAL